MDRQSGKLWRRLREQNATMQTPIARKWNTHIGKWHRQGIQQQTPFGKPMKKWKHTNWKLLHPKHQTRDTMSETKRDTCKQTRCKIVQPRHPRRDTMQETNVKKCKQTHCKMAQGIWKRSWTKWSGQSGQQGTPCGRQMKKQCRPSARWCSHSQCIQHQRTMRATKHQSLHIGKSSGQGI